MSEIPNVLGGDTATANWANLVKERTAMRYASVAERTASIPAPIDGSLAWLDDTNDLTIYADGDWQNVAFSGGNVNSLSWGGPLTGILHEDGSATFNNGMRVEQSSTFEGGIVFGGPEPFTSRLFEDGSATFNNDLVVTVSLEVRPDADINMTDDASQSVRLQTEDLTGGFALSKVSATLFQIWVYLDGAACLEIDQVAKEIRAINGYSFV